MIAIFWMWYLVHILRKKIPEFLSIQTRSDNMIGLFAFELEVWICILQIIAPCFQVTQNIKLRKFPPGSRKNGVQNDQDKFCGPRVIRGHTGCPFADVMSVTA